MKPILLSGPPGAGKSSLAPALASRLGLQSVDLDALIASRAGVSVPALLAARGEVAFRELERAVLGELLRGGPCVVALGGGALTSSAMRRRALREGVVIALDAPFDTLLTRITHGAPRPLVTSSGDPSRALRELLDARRDGYAEAHATLSSEGCDVAALATKAAGFLGDALPLVVPLGARSYRVHLGSMDGFSRAFAEATSRAVTPVGVTDSNVARRCAWMQAQMPPPRGAWLTLRAGESSKTLRGAQRVWAHALEHGLDRGGVVLCHGGGVVSDLGGFAAATLLRGVRYVTVPTTLLAMADASVGGKTAVDHPRGKNLIGAFHHPSLVWIDVAALRTLPRRELRAGIAEVVKIAVMRDPELLSMLERDAEALAVGDDPARLEAALRRAVQAKIDVVAEDEREHGPRALLNFGHTVGHALEAASRYRLRHGECVAVGMRAALALGEAQGITPRGMAARVGALLDRMGLPSTARVSLDDALRAMGHDKKREGATLRFALATGPGEGTMREVTWKAAREALASVIETRSTARSRL